jgi:hypothetical protein
VPFTIPACGTLFAPISCRALIGAAVSITLQVDPLPNSPRAERSAPYSGSGACRLISSPMPAKASRGRW